MPRNNKKNNKYSKELLEPIVNSSISYAECLRKLGIRPCGGNYKLLQKNIDKFELDITHMLHQAHNQGKEFKSFDELTGKTKIKERLLKELGHKCQSCSITSWNNLPIVFEVEHIDGNNRNNERTNLTLLCPNCHSQTSTFRNKRRT